MSASVVTHQNDQGVSGCLAFYYIHDRLSQVVGFGP